MKKLLISICWLLGMATAHAQNEENIEWQPATKSFGGFLLDMTLMNLQAPPRFSEYRLEVPDASKDYSRLFRLDNSTLYTQGLSDGGIFTASAFGGIGSFGMWGSTPTTLQMGSFRLKNGWRIHTYGQYNKEGRKVYNPAALPWERNDFKGAFELKSANGAFGFRIEVQQQR